MINAIDSKNRELVRKFFSDHWGTAKMIMTSGIHQVDELDGFLYLEANRILGLVTFQASTSEIEIVSLDSQIEGQGIGSALYQQIENLAKRESKSLVLYITNDNLNALKFWQKKGFRMVKILPNAVDNARKIKKEIPLVGYNGIPLQDEILLKKFLNKR